jgi:DNA-binding transcriptional ArsR family regulator
MAVSHPLPDDLVELIAERFRVLSEPTRIKLLDRLRHGEATVLELTELIGTTQQNVSKHLGMLQRAGIVARRKQGNFAHYRIVDESVYSLCEAVCGSLQQQVESLHQLVGETPTPDARAVPDRVVPGLPPRPRNTLPSSLSGFPGTEMLVLPM